MGGPLLAALYRQNEKEEDGKKTGPSEERRKQSRVEYSRAQRSQKKKFLSSLSAQSLFALEGS